MKTDSTEVLEEIRQYINDGNYTKAKACMEEWKTGGHIYSDTAAILDANICEALGDREGMFSAIRHGLMNACDNYELYYMLGYYYVSVNPDQAYLCFQNALHFCQSEEDRALIAGDMEELRQSGQVTVKNTAIIIVSYNACYFMQKNIESIRQTLPKGTYHIIVVDNASDDGVAEWLDEQDDIILLKNEKNEGFPKGCNQGVEAASEKNMAEEDIFLLNNDTRLALNSLFWLKMGLYEKDNIGAVGSYSNYAGNNQQIELDFPLPADYLNYGKTVNIPEKYPYEERVRLSGFAMLIRRSVWDLTGGFDVDFTPGYFEDDDLSMKIQQGGYKLLLCKNSFIYHAGSQSFSACENVEEILLSHYELFKGKYGFDILECAYPNENLLSLIPFSADDEFNVLQVSSKLGADLKYIASHFPKAHVIGIEKDAAMYQISKNTDVVFPSVDAIKNVLKQPVFQILIIAPAEYGNIAKEELDSLAGLCTKGCVVIPGVKAAGETIDDAKEAGKVCDGIMPEKIKLVIWDLDNTFWDGILSEGGVTPIENRIALVRDLTDCGIINSISSKNEKAEAMKLLTDWGLDGYFVFSDINWEGKGAQIRKKLADMGLRAENVLFIDDDVRNLEETKYYNPGIMTGTPDVILGLIEYVGGLDKADPSHKRLEQYRVLEKRHTAQNGFASKEDFLSYSEIRVEIQNNCQDELDRIAELVARTNQLNYTKVRDSREELEALFSDRMVNKGYIRVKDRFGDYGTVGFYCFDKQGKLRHFLFSCRVIGMGVEQYIYNMFGAPDMDIIEPVSVKLVPGAETPWINHSMMGYERADEKERDEMPDGDAPQNGQMTGSAAQDNRVRILFKGPCDLSAIESYLSGGNLTTEFNYVNDRGFITTGQNHSMHIWESAVYPEDQIREILEDVPFLTEGDFKTSLFGEEYHVICYSLLPDCHAGLYRNRRTGAYVSFGSKNFDLTDPKNRQGYIDGSIANHAFPFTEEIIKSFSEDWEFVGVTSNKDLIRNLDYMYTHASGNPVWILLLGSEIEYEGVNEEFADHAAHHKKINDLVKAYAADKERIKIIEMTDFIKTQDDYEDCINHFSRNVYYDLATAVVSCINEAMRS